MCGSNVFEDDTKRSLDEKVNFGILQQLSVWLSRQSKAMYARSYIHVTLHKFVKMHFLGPRSNTEPNLFLNRLRSPDLENQSR